MPQNRECLLVALEGADRVGKATQARMLEGALTAARVRTTVEEIPYKDDLTHAEIYRFLRDGSVRKFPQAFQTLQAINRRNFQMRYLPVLKTHHDVIVLDRWNLSTRVYGAVDGVDEEMTAAVLDGIVEPDITIVLDGAPWPKENLDTLEADYVYQRRVREKYREWCTRDPKNFVLVDASRTKHTVHRDVLEAVRQVVPLNPPPSP